MTAAIYYHPEVYSTSGPKLMGRNAAGESFLRGFVAHSTTSEFGVQVRAPGVRKRELPSERTNTLEAELRR